ncbi:hypothetical protein L1049_022979 [Liquidambar formosana]|uniref:Uncharacterized protein n=1 Tax=Liquidambar formosana TaxID=63359 RepID=A0AAP0WR15_LIQFO
MDDKNTRIDIDQLASTLRGKLLQRSPLPAQCCIFRVPSTLRRHNQTVFAPRLVSIGPLHHGVKNLQAMEKLKLWYLDCLLARAPTIQTSLECFIEAIRGTVERISECYEEVELSTDEMVEMMVLDSCFIIELFRKHAIIVQPHVDDPIFKTSWMRKDLLNDLLLLENQLPWFVLERLFNLTNADPDPK